MAQNFSNLCRDLFGQTLYIKGRPVLDSERNLQNISLATVKNLTVSEETRMEGGALIKGSLNVNKNAKIWGALTVKMNTNLWGDLVVKKKSTLCKKVTARDDLEVQGDTEIFGELTVRDDAQFQQDVMMWGELVVKEDALFKSNVDVLGDANVAQDLTVCGETLIKGNLTVDGITTTINSTIATINDNKLVLNDGEPGAGVTLGTAGIEIDRGTLDNYAICFDETKDSLQSGFVGNLQCLAHRQDSPVANGIAYWNDSLERFDTSNCLTFDVANKEIGIPDDGITFLGNVIAANFIGNLCGNVKITQDLEANSFIGNFCGNLETTSIKEKVLGEGITVEGNVFMANTLQVDVISNANAERITITSNVCIPEYLFLTTITEKETGNGVTVESNANVLGKLTATNVCVTQNADVTGNVCVDGNVQTDVITSKTPGNVLLDSAFKVTGTTNLCNTLNVTGASVFSANVDVNGNTTLVGLLDVTGDTTIVGTTDITGNADVTGNVNITEKVSAATGCITGNLDVNDNVNVDDDVIVGANVCIGDTLRVDNIAEKTNANDINILSNANVQAKLTATTACILGNLDVFGNLNVDEGFTFNDNVTINANLFVDDVCISNDLKIDGCIIEDVTIKANVIVQEPNNVHANVCGNVMTALVEEKTVDDGIAVVGNVFPQTTLAHNLGIPSRKWNKLHVDCIDVSVVETANANISSLTPTEVVFAGAGGMLDGDPSFTFDGASVTVPDLIDTALTAGRVTFAGASQELTDSALLTFSTASGNLTAPKFVSTTLTDTCVVFAGPGGLLQCDDPEFNYEKVGGVLSVGTVNTSVEYQISGTTRLNASFVNVNDRVEISGTNRYNAAYADVTTEYRIGGTSRLTTTHADVTTEYRVGGTRVVNGQGAAVADAAAATAGTLTDSSTGTAGATIGVVGDTSAGDESSAINDNFASTTDEINKLITDVADIRTQFNTLLARLRTATGHGLIA